MAKIEIRICRMDQVEAITYIRVFILSFFIFIISGCSNANKDFRFENCGNWKQCAEALYRLHPIGTDYKDLVKTLSITGARCNSPKIQSYERTVEKLRCFPWNSYPLEQNINFMNDSTKTLNVMSCHYEYLSGLFVSTRWVAIIYFDDEGKILKTSVSVGATGF